jgi:hypothetical protein
MVQMIPEYPETPLLQQKWRAGFCILRLVKKKGRGTKYEART